MKDVLSKIVSNKRIEIERQKELFPFSELERQLLKTDCFPSLSLKDALKNSNSGIISEFKRRSPSKGWLHKDADVNLITKEYESAGASAVSVLTDELYFGGTLFDLRMSEFHC